MEKTNIDDLRSRRQETYARAEARIKTAKETGHRLTNEERAANDADFARLDFLDRQIAEIEQRSRLVSLMPGDNLDEGETRQTSGYEAYLRHGRIEQRTIQTG